MLTSSMLETYSALTITVLCHLAGPSPTVTLGEKAQRKDIGKRLERHNLMLVTLISSLRN